MTVRDLKHTGKLLADGTAAGAYSVYGIDFSIGNQHAAYDVGPALGRARRPLEGRRGRRRRRAARDRRRLGERDASSRCTRTTARLAAAAAPCSASAVVPVKHGTQKVTAQVTVVFSYAS